jgi:hypothetical protein
MTNTNNINRNTRKRKYTTKQKNKKTTIDESKDKIN